MDREQIQSRLAALWQQHLPEIAGRVTVLESACASLVTGSLSEEERKAASAAAHKLAGALGTFGRTRGTELAREVEEMLEGPLPAIGELESRVRDLRMIVESA